MIIGHVWNLSKIIKLRQNHYSPVGKGVGTWFSSSNSNRLPPKKKPTLLSQCWRCSASSQSQIQRKEDLVDSKQTECMFSSTAGADPGFFLGGGALVSCSASTPINHIVFFFLQNTSCIRKPQVISGEGAHPPHPPPRSAPVLWAY